MRLNDWCIDSANRRHLTLPGTEAFSIADDQRAPSIMQERASPLLCHGRASALTRRFGCPACGTLYPLAVKPACLASR